jgi:dihydrolipoamide dehydrogenase
MENNFDVIIIGGGPGGYVCAIRAAQLGLKTACVESRGSLGGTCLNVGCIPSKSLLNLSENYNKAKKDFNNQGIEISDIKLNINKMMSNKNKSVQVLTKGVEFLFKKNKVTYFKGKGVLFSKNDVVVYENSDSSKRTNIKAKNIVIATGSSPTSLPGIEIDEKNIVSSTGALNFSEVPKNLVVIGGGYIGLEMGSVWSRLGSNVTVVEYLDFITPGMDREISNEFKKILTKQGINFKLNNKVTAVKNEKDKVIVEYTNNKTNSKEKLESNKVLVSVGRKPYTEGLNLTKIGVKKDAKGKIEVNEKLQTSIKNIYAIGDVIKGPMLAHKAEEEGIAVAEILAGQSGHVNYDVIPGVIYTSPEVATVGKTEEELKLENRNYKIGKFPFLANSRAKVNNETDGFVKILADSETDKVLGVHIIGPHSGDMIAEMALAMEFGASAEDIARTCHAHPTHTEAIKEAALAVDKRPIHF